MSASDSSVLLHVVSAEQGIFSGPVRYVMARSTHGELGIFPRHTALLTRLDPGELRFLRVENDEEELLYVSGGMLEVQPHVVTILADAAQHGTEIDEAAALEAKKRAEEAMRDSVLAMDRDAAHAELLRALAQLRTLEHARARLQRKGR